MRIIKVIYDDGSNSIVKVQRKMKKQGKNLCDMSTVEIMSSLFGQFR